MIATINSLANGNMTFYCYDTHPGVIKAWLEGPPFPSDWCRVDIRHLFIGEKVEIVREMPIPLGCGKVNLVKTLFDDKYSMVNPVILDYEAGNTIN